MLEVMNCCGITHVGRRRTTNQDQFLIAEFHKVMKISQASGLAGDSRQIQGPSQGVLLAVADGMGGHEAGDRASRLVMDTLSAAMLDFVRWDFNLESDDDSFVVEFKKLFQECQEQLRLDARRFPERRGMGTTLTTAFLRWPHMIVAHAGDSRCYVCRDGRLDQLTRDHTLSQLYRESGEPDSNADGWSNTLWNVVSSEKDTVSPEISRYQLAPDELVLLCTDGLTKHLEADEIGAILAEGRDVETACGRLVQVANERGGIDNVTVVIAGRTEAAESEGLSDTIDLEDYPVRDTTDYVPGQGDNAPRAP